MIPWYGHQTCIFTTWRVSTSGTKISTKYQIINITYVRNVLSLFLFKDNTFFRLLIPFKDIKLFQMITDQIKLQRSVEEDLTPEPQTKWFSSWPFVQPGGRNWSDCTFSLYLHLFYCNFLWMFKLYLHFSGDLRSRLWRLPVQQAHVPCECKSLSRSKNSWEMIIHIVL